ncbi:hypothetical protein BASA61_000872 [Batrachochytrium salamandrivorans]|nr:hypothetical protein BASA61_000872 [Batrachochytrium salamandrivorans]
MTSSATDYEDPQMDDAAFAEWITTSLAALGIADETFAEYILQICTEESILRQEKQEIIGEFLAESLETSATEWVEELLLRNDQVSQNAQLKADAHKLIQQETQRELERELQSLVVSELDQQRRPNAKVLTKEDRRARERLLAQYSYEVDEEVEGENGEIEFIYKDHSPETTLPGEGAGLLTKNRNSDFVKAQEIERKLQAQAEHQKVKARNKEMQEKQALEKEKAKTRTQKRRNGECSTIL